MHQYSFQTQTRYIILLYYQDVDCGWGKECLFRSCVDSSSRTLADYAITTDERTNYMYLVIVCLLLIAIIAILVGSLIIKRQCE